MVVRCITEGLRRHRHVVVPGLGTFLRDASGGLLFTELLREDDGVLASILMEQGRSRIEAAGAIDRYVFELKNALQPGGNAPVGALGTLHADAVGLLHFAPTVPPQASVTAVADTAAAAASSPTAGITPAPHVPAPHVRGQRNGRRARRRPDTFVVVGVAAVLLALGAILYGWYVNREVEEVRPTPSTEAPTGVAPAAGSNQSTSR